MQIRQTQCHHHIENVKELNEPSKSNSDIHNYIGQDVIIFVFFKKLDKESQEIIYYFISKQEKKYQFVVQK